MLQYLSALFLDKHFWTNTGKSFFILFHVYVYCKIYKFSDRTVFCDFYQYSRDSNTQHSMHIE